MFRKLSLALVLAALATGPAWAQFGAKGQKVGPSISPVVTGDTATHEVGRLKGHRTGIQGQKAKSQVASILDDPLLLRAARTYRLAKDPKAPVAKQSAVPGPVPLKDQIQKRQQQLGVKVRQGLADQLNSLPK